METKNVAPEQQEGGSSDTKSTRTANPEEADYVFQKACERLKDVNHWQEYAGLGSAEFLLTNGMGEPVIRPPRAGDHFRINIPGPGNESGEGFDWVRVEEVKGDESGNIFSITVRPAPAPGSDRIETAHFFNEAATSTFCVVRNDNEISVAVMGRNESPNTSVEGNKNRIRNAAVATGAMTIFSKIQWKKLVNGILEF